MLEFLYREAELLDSGRFSQWLGQMTEDITYRMPMRVNRSRKVAPDYSQETEFFSENFASLRLRVERLGTEFAWAEIPPSRTRHLVTNVRVRQTDNPEELEVFSYITRLSQSFQLHRSGSVFRRAARSVAPCRRHVATSEENYFSGPGSSWSKSEHFLLRL